VDPLIKSHRRLAEGPAPRRFPATSAVAAGAVPPSSQGGFDRLARDGGKPVGAEVCLGKTTKVFGGSFHTNMLLAVACRSHRPGGNLAH
jgi:hypothetical protein